MGEPMKVLIIDEMGHNVVKETSILPQLGFKVGCFDYQPEPVVVMVLMFPSQVRLNAIGPNYSDIQAIILVK